MKLRATVRFFLLVATFIGIAVGARAGPLLDLGLGGDFQELSPYADEAIDPTSGKTLEQMRRAVFTPVDRQGQPC